MSTAENIMEEIKKDAPEPDYLYFSGGIRTEVTTAQQFAHDFSKQFLYDHKRSRWLYWGDHIWVPDTTGHVMSQAMRFVHIMETISRKAQDAATFKWAVKCQTKAKLSSIVELSKYIEPFQQTGEQFDTNGMLFAVKNGVIDLRTGQLRDGKPDDFLSMRSEVVYDKDARCPKWQQFLNQVFAGDTDVLHFIHKALGYTMTGLTHEQVVFLCYGTGGNGKSVLFSVLRHILGEYAHTVASSTFKKQQFGSTATNDLADLDRRRLIVNSENITDMKIDEERIKSLSGGYSITARRLYENNFTFTPIGKIWLFTNHRPKVDDDSIGFWRRMRVINFSQQFTGKNKIANLDEILLHEAPGILNWLIDGCLLWQKEGLSDLPASIEEATEAYKAENNPIAEYVLEHYEKADVTESVRISASAVYSHYRLWCVENHKETLTQNAFGRKIGDLGFEKVKSHGTFYYKHLKMQNEANSPEQVGMIDEN